MRLGLAGRPVEDDVRRRNLAHLVSARIDWELAGIEDIDPDTTLTLLDHVAVLEAFAGDVFTRLADECDHHTDRCDLHFGDIDFFDCRKLRVDEVATGQKHLFLEALGAALLDERHRVLEHIVLSNLRTGDFAGDKLLAFLGSDDADLVVGDVSDIGHFNLEQLRIDPVLPLGDDRHLRAAFAAILHERFGILVRVAVDVNADDAAARESLAVTCLDDADLARGHDRHLAFGDAEHQRIDTPRPGRDDGHLCAAFATPLEEGACVLEVVASDLAADDAAVRERLAVTGFYDANLAGLNHEELFERDRVLPRPEPEVESRCQGVGLDAGFTLKRHDLTRGQLAVLAEDDELLDHQTDLVVRDDVHPEQAKGPLEADDERQQENNPPIPEDTAKKIEACFH